MNYVERHFGDWARDTAHLSMLEDGAYNRLCDLYYVRETPLPADVKACCRLVRASSKQERDAVESVLREFFQLEEDGWAHRRCDAEIEKFRGKSSKARASAKARWDKEPAQSDGNAIAYADASPNAMRTHSEGNATRGRGQARSHSPNTNNQDTPNSPQGGQTQPIGLKAWLEGVKERNEKAIPDGDPVIGYAERVGLPHEFLALAWRVFRHTYLGPRKAKRYRDWRATFRNAVEGNWLKLWYLDAGSGVYGLSTVGQQAQRAHDDQAGASA